MIETAESLAGDIGVSAACQGLGVPRGTLYRARLNCVSKDRSNVRIGSAKAGEHSVEREVSREVLADFRVRCENVVGEADIWHAQGCS